jgi:hypothetical protein
LSADSCSNMQAPARHHKPASVVWPRAQ